MWQSGAEPSKTSKEDDELALITDELFTPNLKDISRYEIPILIPSPSPTEVVEFVFIHHQYQENSTNTKNWETISSPSFTKTYYKKTTKTSKTFVKPARYLKSARSFDS